MTPAGRFWLQYVTVAVAIIIAVVALIWTDAHADAPAFQLSDPLCQSGWKIAQRYDERDKDGIITKSVWIPRCVGKPVIIWKKRVRQIVRAR